MLVNLPSATFGGVRVVGGASETTSTLSPADKAAAREM